MTIKYTKEQLNKFDKDLLIELFLGMQGQMEELSRQTQALNAADDGTDGPFSEEPFWQIQRKNGGF
mgnify:CR=1 FL=1